METNVVSQFKIAVVVGSSRCGAAEIMLLRAV
jgi:hypothetical protein